MIEAFNKRLTEKMRGKSLIEMYLVIGAEDMTPLELKKAALSDFNKALETNYKIQHFNNWLAGRKQTPKPVRSLMRTAILQYTLGEQLAEDLKGLI